MLNSMLCARNRKGFTLMEMLIVVAIIAILIAIAIPTFSGTLERSREAADAANIRSAYAEAMATMLTTGAEATATTPVMTQTNVAWANAELAGTKIANTTIGTSVPTKGKTITVKVEADGSVSFTTNA